jgi:gas vesicle protein
VINVVSRAKKPILNLKLNALPQTTTNPITTIENILLLCKQIWYVPFFWTLTWFTYWILRATIILNTPLTQLNPINLIGAIISTSILILASPRLGKTIRKTSALATKHATTNIKKVFIHTFHTRFHAENKILPTSQSKAMNNNQNIRAATLKLQAPLISHKDTIGSGREKLKQKLDGTPEKLRLPQSRPIAIGGGVGYTNGNSVSQELSMECLTCENLTRCRQRRNQRFEAQIRGFQTSKCHFARTISTNKPVAS